MKDKEMKKDKLIATRLTPKMAEELKRRANANGLYVSEYLRFLIVRECGKPNDGIFA